MLLRRDLIQEALSYVHYWERKERKGWRVPRDEAARDAIRTVGLNADEAAILRGALNLPVEGR